MENLNRANVARSVVVPFLTADDLAAVAADVGRAGAELDAARGTMSGSEYAELRDYVRSAERNLAVVRAELAAGRRAPAVMLTAARHVRGVIEDGIERRGRQVRTPTRTMARTTAPGVRERAARLAELKRAAVLERLRNR